jgi:hypothetical protein
MSADFNSITDGAFNAQDSDKRTLFRWGAVIAAVVVVTCFAATSLLKVLGIISASWLWVLAAAGISSVVTGIVVLLAAVLLAAAFVNAIQGIG